MKWDKKKGEYVTEKWEYLYGTYFWGSILLSIIFVFINLLISFIILIPAAISFFCVARQ